MSTWPSTREDINLRSGLARWALIDVHLAPSRMAMARFPRSIGSPSSMIVVGVLRNTTLIPSDVSDPLPFAWFGGSAGGS